MAFGRRKLMQAFTSELLEWLSLRHGVGTIAELRGFGATDNQIDWLVRTGRLVSYRRAVYRLAGAPRTTDQLAALACAKGTDVVVSHFSAGRIWNFRRLGSDRRLHVTIAGQNHRLLPGVAIHRTHRFDPVDIVDQMDGIRVTSRPRTVFDLARYVSDDQLESIIEQVLNEDVLTIPSLLAIGRRLRERGRDGSARFGRVLESRPAWLKPVGSDLELRVERAIVAAGLPRPIRQYEVRLPSGARVRLDFFWPDERVDLEVDHVTWHGGRSNATADKRRDRQLRRAGITTLRVTDDDVLHGLPGVIDDLRAILRPSDVRKA
jgi:hypothetical protein